jgi:hypothetical protein
MPHILFQMEEQRKKVAPLSRLLRKEFKEFRCKIYSNLNYKTYGFGTTGLLEIECDEPLPKNTITSLKKISEDYNTQNQTQIIVTLTGFAYPFGERITESQ